MWGYIHGCTVTSFIICLHKTEYYQSCLCTLVYRYTNTCFSVIVSFIHFSVKNSKQFIIHIEYSLAILHCTRCVRAVMQCMKWSCNKALHQLLWTPYNQFQVPPGVSFHESSSDKIIHFAKRFDPLNASFPTVTWHGLSEEASMTQIGPVNAEIICRVCIRAKAYRVLCLTNRWQLPIENTWRPIRVAARPLKYF